MKATCGMYACSIPLYEVIKWITYKGAFLRQNYICFCLFYLHLISCMNEWVSCVKEGHTICRLSLSVS